MTELKSFDEIDAFLTEYDGKCYHDWWYQIAGGGNGFEDEPIPAHYLCKKCPEVSWNSHRPPGCPPLARNLGKLENYIIKKDVNIEIKSSVANGTLWIELLRCGISLYEIFVKPHEFSTVEEAHCCALGTAIVQVLKGENP